MTPANPHVAAPIDSALHPAPTINRVHATSDVPFTRVQLDTLTEWERSRIVGAIIINRHSLLGTFNQLSAGAIRVLIAMADIFGVARENCPGLIIKAKGIRERLSLSVGLASRSNFAPIRELESLGVLQRGRPGGPNGDHFELIMPPEPVGGSPEQQSRDCEASQSRDESGDEQPLQDKNLARASRDASQSNDNLARASRDFSLDARAFSLSQPGVQIDKSDSDAGNPNARASRDEPLAKLSSLAFSFLARQELKAGRMTIAGALQKAGMRVGHANALSKHPNATIDQVCGGIRKCELKEAEGVRTNREALITAHVKNNWANPDPDHAQQISELPEHEQDVVGPLIEAERSSSPASSLGAAMLALAAPVQNARIMELATQLAVDAPDPEREAAAAKAAADKARRVTTRVGDVESLWKARLAALNPEALDKLAAAAIDQATSSFVRDRFIASRANPLASPLLSAAMLQILTGGDA